MQVVGSSVSAYSKAQRQGGARCDLETEKTIASGIGWDIASDKPEREFGHLKKFRLYCSIDFLFRFRNKALIYS